MNVCVSTTQSLRGQRGSRKGRSCEYQLTLLVPEGEKAVEATTSVARRATMNLNMALTELWYKMPSAAALTFMKAINMRACCLH